MPVVLDARAPADEDHLDVGFNRTSDLPYHAVVHRHVAPTEEVKVLVLDDPFKLFHAVASFLRVTGKKDQPCAVLLSVRQGDPFLRRRLLHEGVGHLDEQARAVTGLFVAAARAAVR